MHGTMRSLAGKHQARKGLKEPKDPSQQAKKTIPMPTRHECATATHCRSWCMQATASYAATHLPRVRHKHNGRTPVAGVYNARDIHKGPHTVLLACRDDDVVYHLLRRPA